VFDTHLLEILACPMCEHRPPLQLVEVKDTEGFLQCTQCRRAFPIIKGIPGLVADESISEEQLAEKLHG